MISTALSLASALKSLSTSVVYEKDASTKLPVNKRLNEMIGNLNFSMFADLLFFVLIIGYLNVCNSLIVTYKSNDMPKYRAKKNREIIHGFQ
jgi:site-specific recombinase